MERPFRCSPIPFTSGTTRLRLAVILGLALLAYGCGGDVDTESVPEQAASSDPHAGHDHAGSDPHASEESAGGGAHAPSGFVPGSYEDWCGSHQVPESACTRCDAALIPAFQATGDWCVEHGIPESQCLVCNSDLVIERPAPTEGR